MIPQLFEAGCKYESTRKHQSDWYCQTMTSLTTGRYSFLHFWLTGVVNYTSPGHIRPKLLSSSHFIGAFTHLSCMTSQSSGMTKNTAPARTMKMDDCGKLHIWSSKSARSSGIERCFGWFNPAFLEGFDQSFGFFPQPLYGNALHIFQEALYMGTLAIFPVAQFAQYMIYLPCQWAFPRLYCRWCTHSKMVMFGCQQCLPEGTASVFICFPHVETYS